MADAQNYFIQQGYDDKYYDIVLPYSGYRFTLRDTFLFSDYQNTSGQQRLNVIYLLFRGKTIWNGEPFLLAGVTTWELYLFNDNYYRPRVGANGMYLPWDTETNSQIPGVPYPPFDPCEIVIDPIGLPIVWCR